MLVYEKTLLGSEDMQRLKAEITYKYALMAYRLQKQGLTPKQIREQIITQFSEQ